MFNRRSFVSLVLAALSAPFTFAREMVKAGDNALSKEKQLLEVDRLMDIRDGRYRKTTWPQSVSIDQLMRLQSAEVVGFKVLNEERLGKVRMGSFLLDWTRWYNDYATNTTIEIPLGYVWIIWVDPIEGQTWKAEYMHAQNLYIVKPRELPWEWEERTAREIAEKKNLHKETV